MNWQKAPLFLAASAAAALLLLTAILLLSTRTEAPEAVNSAEPLKIRELAAFPADFGRLDELVPFSGGVAPVATDVAPVVEHAPEFRDAGWVNAQVPDVFTVQVLAARDESAVKRFLAEREDRARFVYFQYPQGETVWYVVTTGSFPSHELAAGVIESADFGSLPAKPFPRRMGAYQEALKAVPAPSAEAAPAE